VLCDYVLSLVVAFGLVSVFLFFFQAEDGIRDRNVTGVQTCALPISHQKTVMKRRAKQQMKNQLKKSRKQLPKAIKPHLVLNQKAPKRSNRLLRQRHAN